MHTPLIKENLGIESLVSPHDEFFSYFDDTSPPAALVNDSLQAFLDLDAYIETNGPFDAVMAFSHGAALAAAYIINWTVKSPLPHSPFACAIFFSGGVPIDPAGMSQGIVRLMDGSTDGEIITIPTAHIWGSKDKLYPTYGPVLRDLCRKDTRSVCVHDGGHDIPGAGSKDDAVIKAVHVIRRTIAHAAES